MKKGCFIFIIIALLIGVGIIFRFWTIKKAKERYDNLIGETKYPNANDKPISEKKIDPEKEILDRLCGKTIIKNGPIESIEKWSSILPGEWDFVSVYNYDDRFWITKGIFNFRSDNTINFNISVVCYKRGRDYPSIEPKIIVKAGGGLSGKWKFISDSVFQITNIDCDINTYLKAQGSKDYYGCDYWDSIKIGTCSGLGMYAKVEGFNKDTILTAGNDYRFGSDFKFYFTRLK